jgi:cytochrome c oxidase cbb3-type subunit 2
MTGLVLGAVLAVAAGKPSAGPPSGDDWDLRWMVAPPSGAVTAQAPPPATPELRALGRSLYQSRCAGCHGEQGDGAGRHAARLSVAPTNFSRGVYKLRSTPTGSLPTDADLFMTLTRGMHGTPMLPWTALTERERWALVLQLKSFSVRFREEKPAPAIRIPHPPKEDALLRQRGAELYGKLMCARCHGDAGAGDGAAARAYEGPLDGNVHARDFTRGRFLRGAEMEDLYLTLRTGLEGTPMAAYDVLRDDEIWALAAYVRSLIRERPLYDLPPARTHARAPGTGARPAALLARNKPRR